MIPLVAGMLDVLGTTIAQVTKSVFPDPADELKRQELTQQFQTAILENEAKLQEMANSVVLAQIDVNKAEAASTDKFASRWRPFIGWVCGFAFAYHFVIEPLLAFLLSNLNPGVPVVLPAFDMGSLNEVLYGMLGLGVLRTVDKHAENTGKFPWQK